MVCDTQFINLNLYLIFDEDVDNTGRNFVGLEN